MRTGPARWEAPRGGRGAQPLGSGETPHQSHARRAGWRSTHEEARACPTASSRPARRTARPLRRIAGPMTQRRQRTRSHRGGDATAHAAPTPVGLARWRRSSGRGAHDRAGAGLAMMLRDDRSQIQAGLATRPSRGCLQRRGPRDGPAPRRKRAVRTVRESAHRDGLRKALRRHRPDRWAAHPPAQGPSLGRPGRATAPAHESPWATARPPRRSERQLAQ